MPDLNPNLTAEDNAEQEGGKLIPINTAGLHDGKDEMNFAEFPLGVISKRTEPSKKTLVFKDQIVDAESKKIIERKLTVSGSDAYGLPTNTDEDVLLALIQISKSQGFRDRKVYFTRYQLLKILGWKINGQNYDRVEQALNRWVGVTLYYDNSWRFDRRWENKKFHVIEEVSLDGGERPVARPEVAGDQAAFEFASSWFVWNTVVFQSFQSGNLKSLDFASVMALDSAISRRLYRFLDKRFYQRRRLEFDLRNLAYEHIGFARSTVIHEVKRQISEAANELEKAGFLKAIDRKDRFAKVGVGEWRVVFEKAIQTKNAEETENTQPDETNGQVTLSGVEQALADAGVRAETARELCLRFPAKYIEEKLGALEFLKSRKAPSVSLNPAGFLIRSIEDNFENPVGFISASQKEAAAVVLTKNREDKKKVLDETERRREEVRQKEEEEAFLIAQFWSSMTAAERKRHEAEALSSAYDYQKSTMQRAGKEADFVRQTILNMYALARSKREIELAIAADIKAGKAFTD